MDEPQRPIELKGTVLTSDRKKDHKCMTESDKFVIIAGVNTAFIVESAYWVLGNFKH